MALGDPSIRVIRLRYSGRCACGQVLEKGTRAAYDDHRKTVICDACRATAADDPGARDEPAAPTTPPDPGLPGTSAAREYERRKAKRDAETAAMKRGLRKWVRSHTDPPSTTQVWLKGAEGERRVGEILAGLAEDSVYALHDRGIPRSRANIDHIAITASGVHVIDAKHYPRAKIDMKVEGGLFSPRQEILLVRGRRRNDLIAGLASQIVAVEEALDDDPRLSGIPVRAALCFIDAEFPLLRRLTVAEIPIVGPKGLRRLLTAEGEFDPNTRYATYCRLAERLRAR